MRLDLRRHDVPIDNLDPAHEGLVIAHITDVHVGLVTPWRLIRRAVAMANLARPDLTVLTGDYLCYSDRHVSLMGEALSGLRAKSAVVCTLGNHDYWCDAPGATRVLKGNGYDVLKNESTTLNVRGAELTVVGIDDAITRHHDPDRAFAGVPPRGRTIVTLSHCPELADAAAARGSSLTVAGHTHGGQLHFRKLERIYRRVTRRRYLSGWYEVGDSLLYVNPGVGYSSIPVRAGRGGRSEVSIFTLRRA
jgi:predicted MPP superfamily phosphohydrolase